MKRVGIAELKSHLSEHLRTAERGAVVEVRDRARAIARIVPVESPGSVEIVPAEKSFASVRRVRLPRARIKLGSLDALRIERGSH